MTPLAREFLESLTKGPCSITGLDDKFATVAGARSIAWTLITDAHLFDITPAVPMIEGLGNQMLEGFAEIEDVPMPDDRLAFLPATKTWIEYEIGGQRIAVIMLAASVENAMAAVIRLHRRRDGVWSIATTGELPLRGAPYTGEKAAQLFFLYAALAAINTPRLIGRRTHYPHRREEREFLKRIGLQGKFPLRAWTEIILQVRTVDAGGEVDEGHLTGQRCLHYCRSYLWVSRGVVCPGHWRGDGSLGIKQSRYTVRP